MKKLVVDLLVRWGFLTECCHRGTYEPTGWWGREYCKGCNRRIC